jgi:hypothetical protein
MKRTLPLFLLLSVAYFTFQSSGSGVTSGQGADRTNSPVSSGACNNCHSGGSFQSNLTIQLLNANDQVVTSYVPGATYKIKYVINATGASRFGIQSTVLKDDNGSAGTLSANTANAKVSTLSNRTYLDHKAPSTSNEFIANWIAPASGTGKVKIYSNALAANGTGGTDGDQLVSASALEINEGSSASVMSKKIQALMVYPNPAANTLRIQSDQLPEWIEVFSMSGQKLLTEQRTHELNITYLLPGSYLIKVTTDGDTFVSKFFKSE